MQAYVLLEYKAVIFYSYKSGNTSLVEWVYDFVKPKTTKGIMLKRKRPFLSSPNIGIRSPLAFELILEHGFKGAILARDPYKRAVSGFINKFVRDGDVWLKIDRGYEKCALDLMEGKQRFGFIDYLGSIREYHRSSTMHRLNPHFKPQVDPGSRHLIKHLRVMKIEKIAADLGAFCRENGIPFADFPRERSTGTANTNPVEGDVSNRDCFELAQGGHVPGYAQLLSTAAIELIDEIYDVDFHMLGYDKMKPGERSGGSIPVHPFTDSRKSS